MRRAHYIALAAAFLTGCYASFTLPDCFELCEGCEISDCDTFCPRLEAAIESETCHEEGEAEWACVQRIGCDFPLRCREEYAAFDGCEP